jgi:centractin
LPDGQTIELTNHEKEIGEIAFAPKKVGLDFPCKHFSNSAVVELVIQSLEKVDIDLRSTLCEQIVLAGGNTMLTGFPERFIIEMKKMMKTLRNSTKCRLLARPSRDTLCW